LGKGLRAKRYFFRILRGAYATIAIFVSPLGAFRQRAKGEEFIFPFSSVYHFSLANLYHFLLPSPLFMSFQAEMYFISRQVESFILL